MRYLLFFTTALAAACGSSSRTTTPAPENTSYTSPQIEPGPDLAARDCPIELDQANVTAEPTDNGIALVFVADADHVGDLRARVRAFVEAPTAGQAPAEPLDDIRNGSFGTIPVTMSVTDAIDGVRLELRPVDPTQLGDLRRVARAKVVAMETGACGPSEVGRLSPRPRRVIR